MNLSAYDAGLLSDHGGGNVQWWQDYIRAELNRAHEFYASQVEAPSVAPVMAGALILAEIDRAAPPALTGEK